MSFDARIMAFAERFLSDRTFQLVVAPALADLQFEHSAAPLRRNGEPPCGAQGRRRRPSRRPRARIAAACCC